MLSELLAMQCPFLNGKIMDKFIIKKIILTVIEKHLQVNAVISHSQQSLSNKEDGEGSLGEAIWGVAEVT